MKIEAISIYMDNIPKEVRQAQKAVWDKFYPDLLQHHHTYLSHGKTLDKILELTQSEILVIADIDAIPLNEHILYQMTAFAEDGFLIGNAQSSSHLPDTNHVFVAPSFMAINVKLFRELGVSFEADGENDVAQKLTKVWGDDVKFLLPIHYESRPVPVRLPDGRISDPLFWVTRNIPYGLNTTFSLNGKPDTFHGFQSSQNQHDRFISKCEEVLSGNVWSQNNHWQNAEGFFTYPKLYSSIVEKALMADVLIEVGSYKGRSALYMGEQIRNSGKDLLFYCVDHFCGSEEHADKDFYQTFLENIAPLSRYIRPIKQDSVSASKRFKDGDVFFVFIDASHDYESVKADIQAWLPKIRNGGIIAGHDWHHEPIRRAVVELLGEVETTDEDCWVKYL